MIDFLKWDSDFFNLKIGKLKVSKDYIFNYDVFRDYDLIYILSDQKLSKLQDSFMDNKLVYSKDVNSCDIDDDILKLGQLQPYDENSHSYEHLLNLVYESGKFSRFKLDKRFGKDSFYKFYEQWILNSINHNFSDYTMVLSEKSLLIGFTTLKVTSNNCLQIQLISVSNKYQGMGYGRLIMNNIFKMAKKLNCHKITVATQFSNLGARKFYENSGFKQFESTYIYHLWTN